MINTPPRDIGLHVQIDATFCQMAERVHQAGMKRFQFFFSNYHDGSIRTFSSEDRTDFISRWRNSFDAIYAHCSYRINFSSTLYTRHPVFERERALAQKFGCTHLVLHPGTVQKKETKAEGIQAFARFLNQATDVESDLIFLLENTVGQSGTVGAEFSDFIQLYPLLSRPEKIGLCIDTAHAYVMGYDLATIAGQDRFEHEVSQVAHYFPLSLLHANDTTQLLSSRLDKHDLCSQGNIGLSMMRRLIELPLFANVPIVIEPPFAAPWDEQLAAIQALRGL